MLFEGTFRNTRETGNLRYDGSWLSCYEPKPRFVRERVEMVHDGRYDKAKYRSDEEIRNFIVGLRKG